jgi:hypothetical protein
MMTPRPLRVSAIALGVAALALFLPLAAANAATGAQHYRHATHPSVSHGAYGYVAHNRAGARHYVSRNGRHYAYGYNPGAAAAAVVIGGALGAAAGNPYTCEYDYGPYGGCDYGDYGWGGDYAPYYGGFGYGYAPGFYGGNFGHGFHGGGAHFASGNFGHMGFGGGHFGGFGGGHMGGFGGGHFGVGGRLR